MNLSSLERIVERYARGEISAPIATMELLLETQDIAALSAGLAAMMTHRQSVLELSQLVREHAAGCATITAMLRTGLDLPEGAPIAEVAIAQSRRLFDHSVSVSPEASVALYSLGSPKLLAEATVEVVSVLEAWGVLARGRDALEIGCGIGRLLEPLAPRLRRIVGIDISCNMLDVARSRLGLVPNLELELTNGRDLRDFEGESFDLVYCVDAFPYVVRGGADLVAAHFNEVARVLKPAGDFVIFNYAYGRPRHEDAEEVAAFAAAAKLSVVRSDVTPFLLWNGVGFHLKRD